MVPYAGIGAGGLTGVVTGAIGFGGATGSGALDAVEVFDTGDLDAVDVFGAGFVTPAFEFAVDFAAGGVSLSGTAADVGGGASATSRLFG